MVHVLDLLPRDFHGLSLISSKYALHSSSKTTEKYARFLEQELPEHLEVDLQTTKMM